MEADGGTDAAPRVGWGAVSRGVWGRRVGRALVADCLLAGVALAQAPASPAPAPPAVVAGYCAAWGERDAVRRDSLLRVVWADDGRYLDPSPVELHGRAALSAHIQRFLAETPGLQWACSAPQFHHGSLRFTWMMRGADGRLIADGMDFGELGPDGRLRRIVGFFGAPPTAR